MSLGVQSQEPHERLVALGRALRSRGVAAGTGRLLEAARAASLLPPGDLYWAGRVTLVSRREQLEAYDAAFSEVFGGDAGTPPRERRPLGQRVRVAAQGLGAGQERTIPGEAPEAALAASEETLRHTSFSRLDDEELALLARVMAQLELTQPTRRTRRRIVARAGMPDLRRTLRLAMRTGGEPAERAWRTRRRVRRRLVLILDVSGSMAPYSRALLLFAHAALRTTPSCEAFAFGTQLTRLSHPLRAADPDDAFARASDAATDWDGGTRIGESLRTLLADGEQRALLRGSIALIMSDGLDVGDPDVLRGQMERLSRLARSVVWLNPLMENAEYEPLARGMRAALPSIDHFLPGHDLASLERMADVLGRI